jgi:hypothetical protein
MRKAKVTPQQVYENERKLRGPVIYVCDGRTDTNEPCTWQGRADEMVCIDDVEDRVGVGELMAAGQCPDCGSMFSVHDDEVPYYTIMQCVEIAKKNGLL